jgi:hypothetical protein
MQDNFNALKTTLDNVVNNGRIEKEQLRDNFEARLEAVAASSQDMIETLKDTLHQTEKGHLQLEIQRLQSKSAEENSEGLGNLLREVGEGVGMQMEGLRNSLNNGLDKVGTIAEKAITANPAAKAGEAIMKSSLPNAGPLKKVLSPSEAAALAEAEGAIETLISSAALAPESDGEPRQAVLFENKTPSSGKARLISTYGDMSSLPSNMRESGLEN